MQELKQRGALESTVDYYALVGLRRGCSRSELERAHLLLCLRHGPDKAVNFVDRCEFMDYHDVDLVKDQARMSSLLLYRLLQKAYSNIMTTIMDEAAAKKQRQKTANALKAAATIVVPVPEPKPEVQLEKPTPMHSPNHNKFPERENPSTTASATAAAVAFQGGFCRDIVIVSHMLSKANFSHSIPMKYEALSC